MTRQQNDDRRTEVAIDKLRQRDKGATLEEWQRRYVAHMLAIHEPSYRRIYPPIRLRGQHKPKNPFQLYGSIVDDWVHQRVLVRMAVEDIRWIKPLLPRGRKDMAPDIAIRYAEEKCRPVSRGAIMRELRRNPVSRRLISKRSGGA